MKRGVLHARRPAGDTEGMQTGSSQRSVSRAVTALVVKAVARLGTRRPVWPESRSRPRESSRPKSQSIELRYVRVCMRVGKFILWKFMR
jgi:hypothetical protein